MWQNIFIIICFVFQVWGEMLQKKKNLFGLRLILNNIEYQQAVCGRCNLILQEMENLHTLSWVDICFWRP